MKKRTILIGILSIMVVTLVVISTADAMPSVRTLGGPTKTTPQDLPVLKLPSDLLTSLAAPAGNPQGTPPGQTQKPPKTPVANKWAVVIGIADYAGTEYDLWHPDEDAKDMASALITNYGFSRNNVKLILNNKATARAIVAAIDWLVSNEDSDSTVVFFYSGHGFNAADSEGWDLDIEDDGYDEGIVSYDFYGLIDGFLKQKFSALESHKVALCFGSCNSGGMFDDDDDLQGDGRVIVSACKADQYAWDYLLYGNTLWGRYFVDQGILQSLADLNIDGSVSIEEAHNYAYPLVIDEQPDSQPQIYDNFTPELVP